MGWGPRVTSQWEDPLGTWGRGSVAFQLYPSMTGPKDLVSLSPPPRLRPQLPTQQIFQDTLFREFPSNDISLSAHSNQRPGPQASIVLLP